MVVYYPPRQWGHASIGATLLILTKFDSVCYFKPVYKFPLVLLRVVHSVCIFIFTLRLYCISKPQWYILSKMPCLLARSTASPCIG